MYFYRLVKIHALGMHYECCVNLFGDKSKACVFRRMASAVRFFNALKTDKTQKRKEVVYGRI